jgi:ABC-type transport system substrate-binding protein
MKRAALALLALLAACPGPTTPSDGGSPRPTSLPRRGDRGGEVRVAYPWEPPTLNPFVRGGEAPATRELVRPLLPAFWRIGSGGAVEPWLAVREPSGSDVLSNPPGIRVRLRPDAVWSDGTPITATDVRFTWRTIMDARWPIASREGYDRIRDVAAEDAKTVRITFDAPFERWHDLFAAGLGVLPEHKLRSADFGAALAKSWPVSGGPFVLASYTPGFEIVYRRTTRPWGPLSEPLLDTIRIQIVPDADTAFQLYRRGAVDVLGPYLAPDFARRAGGLPGAVTSRDEGSVWVGLVLNTKTPALADVRTRLALVRAVDRAGIIAGLVRDEGSALEDPFVSASEQPSAFAPLTGNSDAAEQLLNDAGWTSRDDASRKKGNATLDLSLVSAGYDALGARVLRVIHSQAGGVGFRFNLIDLGAEDLWRDWMRSSRFQVALIRFVDAPGGSARARSGGAYVRPKGINFSGLADATLDAALAEADQGTPGALSRAASRLAELVGAIPLWRVRVTLVARQVVNGVQAAATADGMLWNCQDWWRNGGASATPSQTP